MFFHLALQWTMAGGSALNFSTLLGIGMTMPNALAAFSYIAALIFGRVHRVPLSVLATATLVGDAVFAGWAATYAISQSSFDVIMVQSVAFTGPSTDIRMALVITRDVIPIFGLGLVPSVFIGSFLIALIKGKARIQRFDADNPMERYLASDVLKCFRSMFARGCTVGSGMAGGSIMALTALVAVFCMWMGAMITFLWKLSRTQLVQSV